MQRIAPCLAALALLAAHPAAAQTAATPVEGARVRVAAPDAAPSRWVVGTVVAGAPDSLTLLRADTRERFSVHRSDVDAVQVSRGHRPTGRTVARYAGIGALVGVTTGALLGVVSYEADRGEGLDVVSQGEMAAIGAWVIGAAGTVVGGVVGWRRSGEQWAEVPFRAAPSVAVQRDGGVGVALSVRL